LLRFGQAFPSRTRWSRQPSRHDEIYHRAGPQAAKTEQHFVLPLPASHLHRPVAGAQVTIVKPRVPTNNWMPAIGPWRTWDSALEMFAFRGKAANAAGRVVMSALSPKADIHKHVR